MQTLNQKSLAESEVDLRLFRKTRRNTQKVSSSNLPTWTKYLPYFFRKRLASNSNILKIANNIGWLTFEKVLRLGVGLIVGVWMARYLGPKQFGQLNYVIAFISLFTPFASLGLYNIVVRDLVKSRDQLHTTMGTALVLQLGSGVAVFGVVLLIAAKLHSQDEIIRLMIAILGLSLVLKSSEVIKYWFDAQTQSRYYVWVESSAFILVTLVKVTLILLEASLLAFFWAFAIEAALVALGLAAMYVKQEGGIRAWNFKVSRAHALLRESWPVIFAGFAVIINLRIDQIMLNELLGNEAVGVYSAAVRISEAWYLIPTIIVSSIFPAIVRAKENEPELYLNYVQKLYRLMVWISLPTAVIMTFSSDWLVGFLFGSAYQDAGIILSIHIWNSIFIFLNVVSGRWFIIEGYLVQSLYRYIAGALINIALNYLLIPQFGLIGAAVASIISTVVYSIIFNAFSKTTRVIFLMQIRAFLLFSRNN